METHSGVNHYVQMKILMCPYGNRHFSTEENITNTCIIFGEDKNIQFHFQQSLSQPARNKHVKSDETLETDNETVVRLSTSFI